MIDFIKMPWIRFKHDSHTAIYPFALHRPIDTIDVTRSGDRPRVLVTGANGAIARALIVKLLQAGYFILACPRNLEYSSELMRIGEAYADDMCITPLDITDETQIKALATDIDYPIDLLINGAGLLGDTEKFPLVSTLSFLQTYETNTVGPFNMCKYFLPHVAASQLKSFIFLTSLISDDKAVDKTQQNSLAGFYPYSASKAALQRLIDQLSEDLKQRDIHTLSIDPGWVRTPIGGPYAELNPIQSAEHIVNKIQNALKDCLVQA